jgi:hypothetical protein
VQSCPVSQWSSSPRHDVRASVSVRPGATQVGKSLSAVRRSPWCASEPVTPPLQSLGRETSSIAKRGLTWDTNGHFSPRQKVDPPTRLCRVSSQCAQTAENFEVRRRSSGESISLANARVKGRTVRFGRPPRDQKPRGGCARVSCLQLAEQARVPVDRRLATQVRIQHVR